MIHSVTACTELESAKGNSTGDYTTTFYAWMFAIVEAAVLDRDCVSCGGCNAACNDCCETRCDQCSVL